MAAELVKIANTLAELNLSENNLTQVTAEGNNYCIALYNDTLYATAAKCPHASGIMANGYIDALGNITCPLHRYKFSLAKGRNVSGEGYYLKTYTVIQTEQGIFIQKEKTNLFKLFGV